MDEFDDPYLEQLMDELDAVVFSSDRLHDEKTMTLFHEYLDRWKRETQSVIDNNFYEETA